MKSCPICLNQSTALKFKLKYDIYQCSKCGLEFCPDASFNHDFVSDLDEQRRKKALKNLRIENFSRIIAAMKPLLPKIHSGLEVGCGYGWFLESCKENNIYCSGIEPETQFNTIYNKGGFSVRNGFFPQILGEDEHFDFVIFNDVLEHIHDLQPSMKKNYSVLNKDGLLVINLPRQEGLFYFFSKIAYYFGFKDLLNRMWQFNFHSPHLFYFKKKNIIELAKNNKFTLIDSFPLKTIKFSEISDRIKQDQKQSLLKFFISWTGTMILYPFINLFPDTYCFIFRKNVDASIIQ